MQAVETIYKRGTQLAEGKTKRIHEVVGMPYSVELENTVNITALDNPALTKQFETKAISATQTTCSVFELLRDAGIPVAYSAQLSPTSFMAPKCTMIPLEVIARRYAVGSYLKRHPDLERDGTPYRFEHLLVEFFLKTTSGELTVNGKTLVEGLDAKAGEEDPFISNPGDDTWSLHHSKKPSWAPEAALQRFVCRADVFPIVKPENVGALMQQMRRLTAMTFLVLEKAWALLGCRLIDFKIEFGFDHEGKLFVADVIDNDSWRLRTDEWEELSKQLFRDGVDLAKVEVAYNIVAALTDTFHIPKQALVLWTGSEKDEVPDLPNAGELAAIGVNLTRVCKSAHKATQTALQVLSSLEAAYPNGGVIVAAVGRSNGLGPVLSTHTDWPVVSLCLSQKEFPDDVWSSLRMPSNVPVAMAWPAANAFQIALRILGQSNPAVYAQQRYALEQLDQ